MLVTSLLLSAEVFGFYTFVYHNILAMELCQFDWAELLGCVAMAWEEHCFYMLQCLGG